MRDIGAATVMITGAAKGIGRGIARALASAGCRLALADRDRAALERVASELRRVGVGRLRRTIDQPLRYPERHRRVVSGDTEPETEVASYQLDVRDRQAYADVVDRIETELGPITVLCNNAGLVFPEDVTAMSYEVSDLALGVNLGGVVNGVQSVLPRMIDRGVPGHIVNTASVAGLGPGGGVMYTTSKYAVVGLSEALRDRLSAAGLPIGVSVLCPGAVLTDVMATGREAISTLRSEDSRAAREYAERLTDSAAGLLATYGKDPDDVGRMVLDAIRDDRPFVLTDRVVEPKLRERTELIVRSMPEGSKPEGPKTEGAGASIYQSAANLREHQPTPPGTRGQ